MLIFLNPPKCEAGYGTRYFDCDRQKFVEHKYVNSEENIFMNIHDPLIFYEINRLCKPYVRMNGTSRIIDANEEYLTNNKTFDFNPLVRNFFLIFILLRTIFD